MDTKGNPHISATTQKTQDAVTQEQMLIDTEELLSEFSADYQRMAE